MTFAPDGNFLGIHHVQLAIPPGSEPECRKFWHDLLGFTELIKPPVLAARGGCWFRGGGVEVHLGVEEDFRPAKKAHPAIQLADVEAVAAHLQAHEIAVQWDENMPGTRRCYVFDLLGNRLELMQLVAQ